MLQDFLWHASTDRIFLCKTQVLELNCCSVPQGIALTEPNVLLEYALSRVIGKILEGLVIIWNYDKSLVSF